MQWRYDADKPSSLVETPYLVKWEAPVHTVYSRKRRYFYLTRTTVRQVVRLWKDFDTSIPAGIEIDQHKITEFMIKLYNNINLIFLSIRQKLAHPTTDIQTSRDNEGCN